MNRMRSSARTLFFAESSCFQIPCLKNTRYLVDPASSHMLVSRIKPCKCQSNCLYQRSAYGSLNGLLSTQRRWFQDRPMDNSANCGANTRMKKLALSTSQGVRSKGGGVGCYWPVQKLTPD